MPNTKKAEPPTEAERARIVTGPDPDRFYCPHPGCNRSFAELWRLKVHFRAPPDVRGSGKERGHGTELKFCPKCGKDLRPGKHHVGCSAGKSAPRQAAKRQRQQQMSTTTESAGLTAGTTEQTTGSWELAVKRAKVQQQRTGAASEADSTQRTKRAAACQLQQRLQTLEQTLELTPAGDLRFHPAHLRGAAAPGASHGSGNSDATLLQPMALGGPAGGAGGTQHGFAAPAGMSGAQLPPPAQLPHLDLPQQHGQPPRSLSPSLHDIFADPFGGATDGAPGGEQHGHGQGGQEQQAAASHDTMDHLLGDHDDLLLRIPSPPPLPADWDTVPRPGLLFDFDQFDITKRQQVGTSAPLVTVTTAMNPADVANPSDDYIWQILFAGENDAVPKRVTAHLHHPPATALTYFDEPDPLLDAILSDDMLPVHGSPSGPGPAAHHPQQQQQQQPAHAALPSLDAVFQHSQQQQVQQQVQQPVQQQQVQQPVQQHQQPLLHAPTPVAAQCSGEPQVVPQPQPYRNGFGSHPGPEMLPAVKLDTSAFLS